MDNRSIAYAGPVVKRTDAIRLHLKRYFTGAPCSKGHHQERQTSNGMCYGCYEARRRRKGQRVRSKASNARKIAKENYQLRYFTGYPCKRGHICQRYVLDGRCIKCGLEDQKKQGDKWKKAHPERWAAFVAQWTAENADKLRISAKRRRELNLDRRLQSSREWYQANKTRARASIRTRKARLRGAEGSHSAGDIADLFTRQHGKCANCKVSIEKAYHVDHIMPIILDGSNDVSNLELLCPRCNLSKRALHPDEWARRNGRLFI